MFSRLHSEIPENIEKPPQPLSLLFGLSSSSHLEAKKVILFPLNFQKIEIYTQTDLSDLSTETLHISVVSVKKSESLPYDKGKGRCHREQQCCGGKDHLGRNQRTLGLISGSCIFIWLTMDKPGSHLWVLLLSVEWAGSIKAPLMSFSGQEVGVTNLAGDGE